MLCGLCGNQFLRQVVETRLALSFALVQLSEYGLDLAARVLGEVFELEQNLVRGVEHRVACFVRRLANFGCG